jgi:MOSC domain-containing protein YiiM
VLILNKGKVAAHDSVEHLRELMHQPSLEGIFAELTRERDHQAVAGQILGAMQA